MSKTPPPQPPQLIPQVRETPIRLSGSASAEYRSGDLEDSRNSVLGDIMKIPIAPVDKLLTSLFPLVNEDIIDSAAKHLRANGKLNGDRFSHFSTAPANSAQKEPDAFRPLEALYSDIISSVAHSRPVEATKLVVAGSTTPWSPQSSSSRPDGYILRVREGSNTHWSDILVPFEFKKANSESLRTDDMEKIIWSMHHMMRSDPCRRFALGITIENTHSRLWYCDRSAWYASESFDLIKDSRRVIRLFLSIGLGSLESLGLDPTIRRIPSSSPNSDEQFEIDVHGPHIATDHEFPPETTTFITVDLISDFGADAVRGRGTRVWKVVRKSDPDGKFYALKDVWVNPTYAREHMILDSVLQPLGPIAKENFLTVCKAGDVVLSMWGIGYCADSTLKSRRWQEDDPLIASTYIYTSPFKFGTGKGSGSIGHPPFISTIGDRVPVPPGAKELLNHDRQHYRIVFEEIGIPVHTLETQVEIFTALKGAVQALESLKNIGYVHRDVSSGNILLVKRHPKAAVGVLMDLEYAKPIGDSSTHEFRTGTKDFIAHEVVLQKYMFLPLLPLERRVRPIFHHNYLHDLESAWWVAIWASTYLIPVGDKWTGSAIRSYLTLFPPKWENLGGGRPIAFQSDELAELTDEIPSNRTVLSELITWRNQLGASYVAYERNYPGLDTTAFAQVHQQALERLDVILGIVNNAPLQRMSNTRGVLNKSGSCKCDPEWQSNL